MEDINECFDRVSAIFNIKKEKTNFIDSFYNNIDLLF